MTYLILAQICLTVGTPDWVVVLCYVLFALSVLASVLKCVAKTYLDKYDK